MTNTTGMANTNETVPFEEFPSLTGINRIIFTSLYVILTIIGILGNIIIITTISTNRQLRCLTYFLLLNLAISDLVFALIGSLHAHTLLHPGDWLLSPIGDVGCKIYYFLFRSLYACSVLILIVISVERFVAVKFPVIFREKRKQIHARYIIPSIWISGFLVTGPIIKGATFVRYGTYCECIQEGWTSVTAFKSYYSTIHLTLYLFPLILMLILYKLLWNAFVKKTKTRGVAMKKKMARMLMLLVTAFFVCWTPWTIIEFITVINDPWNPPDYYYIVFDYAMLPVFGSAAVNPVLYGLMSDEMKKGFLNTTNKLTGGRLERAGWWNPRAMSISTNSQTITARRRTNRTTSQKNININGQGILRKHSITLTHLSSGPTYVTSV